MPQSFVLRYNRAPGDTLLTTGLLRDIKAAYPDIAVDVRTTFPILFRNNPFLTPLTGNEPGCRTVVLSEVPATRRSQAGEKIHYARGFHISFEQQTGLKVPLTKPHADLHLTHEELTQPYVSGRYWVVIAGGKTDATNKWWELARTQELVNQLRDWGLRFVQDGGIKRDCYHPPLTGVLNLVGRSNIRDMMVNILHSEGVITPVSLQMHLAAALGKPCVVIAGSREEPWWESYSSDFPGAFGTAPPPSVPHRYLHNLGQLDCARTKGCWRRRVVPRHDKMPEFDRDTCKYPVQTSSYPVAKCLDMISVDTVANAVKSYYTEPPANPIEPALLRPTEMLKEQMAAIETLPYVSKMPELNHPALGGRITICCLLYGDHVDLHRRCLDSIVKTVPLEDVDLRIGCNQIGEASREYLLNAMPHGCHLYRGIIYPDFEERRKYPAMREMLHDGKQPIDTKWVVWFDDDSHVVDPSWLSQLCRTIAAQEPGERIGMLGQIMRHPLRLHGYQEDPREWFRKAAWWQGKSFRNAQSIEAPNGDQVFFITGGFWAMSTEAMRKCQVPDTRLIHHGGDACIGEQLHQGGYKLKQFNSDKQLVRTSDASPRGFSGPNSERGKKFLWYQ